MPILSTFSRTSAVTNSKRPKGVGRNDPCPCGSGKKLKHCHGAFGATAVPSPDEGDRRESLRAHMAAMQARQLQREKQQGLGRPIISESFQGYRIVAVGNRLHYSKKWLTFHDFLFEYLPSVMGREWGASELKKPKSDRHPLFVLYAAVTELKRKHGGKSSAIQSAPMTGAAAAYLGLAYHLYLLAHNATLQEFLLKRLRIAGQFWPALYETFVAASFIKAGFTLTLEDETDTSMSHCEFVAKHRGTGKSFSVEAKARKRNKKTAGVSNQLYEALRKMAAHERIVCIDVNIDERGSQSSDPTTALPWLREAVASLRAKEGTMTINKKAAPPAYILLTSQPYEACLSVPYIGTAFVSEGFKISHFKFDHPFSSVREARIARDNHREVYDLLESVQAHWEIPLTFDGEIPEFAFGDQSIPRLIIGRTYKIPGPDGEPVEGVLQTATVLPSKSEVTGIYQLPDGKQIIATCPLSPAELAAYERHQDTFFGTYLRQGRRADSPLDLFDFFLESYGKTSKEGLLKLMEKHPDVDSLHTLPQPELAAVYCERMAEAAARESARNVNSTAATGNPGS